MSNGDYRAVTVRIRQEHTASAHAPPGRLQRGRGLSPDPHVAGLRGNRLVTAPLGPRTPRTHIPVGIGPYTPLVQPPPARSARARSAQACARLFSSARPWARASCFWRWHCRRPGSSRSLPTVLHYRGGASGRAATSRRAAPKQKRRRPCPRLSRRPACGAPRARRRGRARRALQRRPRPPRARGSGQRLRPRACAARRAGPRSPCPCRSG